MRRAFALIYGWWLLFWDIILLKMLTLATAAVRHPRTSENLSRTVILRVLLFSIFPLPSFLFNKCFLFFQNYVEYFQKNPMNPNEIAQAFFYRHGCRKAFILHQIPKNSRCSRHKWGLPNIG